MTHVVERANGGRVVGQEYEFVAKVFGYVGGNLALALWVHVAAASNLVTASLDDVNGVGQRDARERNGRHNNVDVEQALDVGTVLF